MRCLARFLAAALLSCAAVTAHAEERLWEKLRNGGHVVLMRHAQTTPGVGDPQNFDVADCSTQRNLSPEGREQARRIGEVLRRRGVRIGAVESSRWCRAIETARLAFGRARVWEPLNSTFHDRSRKEAQTEAVRRRIAAFRGPDNLFLVGHGSNILALTGEHPGMGGMVVVAPGGPEGFRFVGRLEPDGILSAQSESR